MEDLILVTLEDVLAEVKDALEYGRSLGYSECLGHTVQGKAKSDTTDQAIEFYVNSIKESYESDDDESKIIDFEEE